MKKIIYLSLIFILFLFVSSCSSSEKDEVIIIHKSDISEECFSVEGMTCVGCEVTLEEELSKIEGVIKVRASSRDNEATISYDQSKISSNELIDAIQKAGYEPTKK